ncbi:unnamed protein product, partial [Adineta steineri]
SFIGKQCASISQLLYQKNPPGKQPKTKSSGFE